MARHGGVANVRQAEFLQRRRALGLRHIVDRAKREEAIDEEFFDIVALQVGAEGAADNAAAAAEHRDRGAGEFRIAEELLLGLAA